MKKIITLQVSEDLYNKIYKKASEKTLSISAYIRTILLDYLNE